MISPPLVPRKKSSAEQAIEGISQQMNDFAKKISGGKTNAPDAQPIQTSQQTPQQPTSSLYEEDLTQLPEGEKNYLSPEVTKYYESKINHVDPRESTGFLPRTAGNYERYKASKDFKKANEIEGSKFSNKHPTATKVLKFGTKLAGAALATYYGGPLINNLYKMASFFGTDAGKKMASLGATISKDMYTQHAKNQAQTFVSGALPQMKRMATNGELPSVILSAGSNLSKHVSPENASILRQIGQRELENFHMFTKPKIILGQNLSSSQTKPLIADMSSGNAIETLKNIPMWTAEVGTEQYNNVFLHDNPSALIPTAIKRKIVSSTQNRLKPMLLSADEESYKNIISLINGISGLTEHEISLQEGLDLGKEYLRKSRDARKYDPKQRAVFEQIGHDIKNSIPFSPEGKNALSSADKTYAMQKQYESQFNSKASLDDAKFALSLYKGNVDTDKKYYEALSHYGFDMQGDMHLSGKTKVQQIGTFAVLAHAKNLLSSGDAQGLLSAYKFLSQANTIRPSKQIGTAIHSIEQLIKLKGMARAEETRKGGNGTLDWIIGSVIHNTLGSEGAGLYALFRMFGNNPSDAVNDYINKHGVEKFMEILKEFAELKSKKGELDPLVGELVIDYIETAMKEGLNKNQKGA